MKIYKNLSRDAKCGVHIVLGIYALFNIIAFGVGVHDAGDTGYYSDRQDCIDYPKSRVGYLNPAYGVGCWMGKPLKKDEK